MQAKRAKNAQLTIHREIVVALPVPPADATFKGYEDYVVQELLLEPRVTRYRREAWQDANGHTLLAPLPDEVVPGSHFGPTLHSYLLHQYYHQRVTQPLLLEQMQQLGIDLSAGQLNNLLTENRDVFHREKDALLPAGLAVSSYVQVDDTGARTRGRPATVPTSAMTCSPTLRAPTIRAASTSWRFCGRRTPTISSATWPTLTGNGRG